MNTDQRQSLRKELRIRATLSADGLAPLQVQTMDVGKFGMGLVGIPLQLQSGLEVQVAFDLFFNGKVHDVAVSARVAYCFYDDSHGFKAGLQFNRPESAGADLIAQYIGQ